MILGIDVGQKNLGICVLDGTLIRQWGVWECSGSWAREVFECLREYATSEFLEGVTHVVIERQPSKNPTMTRIMHYLEFFFVSLGHPVTLQDSKHKLLFASTTPWFPGDSTDKEWTYRHRKKLAVQTVTAFVKDTGQATLFDESKKKDDLADALLHAMAYASFSKASKPVNGVKKTAKEKKLVARAPTPNQRRTGKLSASNVKYLLTRSTDVAKELKEDRQLARALKKHFGDLATFERALGDRS